MRFLFGSDLNRLRSIAGEFTEEINPKDIRNSFSEDVSSQKKTTNQSYFSKLSRSAKRSSFEQDYPTFLLSLASSIRTGLDPISAIKAVLEMLPEKSILKFELIKLTQRLDSGESEEEAILSFGESIQHPDISLLTTSLLLARKEGSSLGQCLQRLNKVTRQRQSFRRKAKAALAMQKLSSFGIAGCSVVIGFSQILMNPDNFVKAFDHPMGRMLLSFGIALLIIGTVWMMFISRARE